MVELQRILFLTDFSPESTQALEYARELADKFGSRLYVLHVIVDATSKLYNMVSGDYHALDRNAQEKTREWLDKLHREQLHSSPNCETLIERGELFEHVLKVVHEKHIDLIVMSAHTHPGFHIHLISNLPEKLVRKAPCHVFVVHTGTA
ncbi:MAG: universal stress protein [Candidatus Binatia bacterium]|nr:universal stress protein [Candidatus Binatia bacterium]